ncbi:cbb3-type cytochrome c oxidase subunit I [Haloprofundus halobius]|uniref:cbb3-type cytochrome c oxidase subunit I n=1 Tax=Haloprofundus halobius TaxID=2876194 RepID=UPI001CC96CDD|nr:cbb3-type cytochrome c oxidase subunit I [Haloprofundus halobius]
MGLFLVGVALWLTRVGSWRQTTPLGVGSGETAERRERVHAEKPGGLLRWLTTVDHKDIGILYGVFSTVALFWAGTAIMLMRAELFTPETVLLEPALYNGFLTTHGITMLFLVATPGIAAFANYFIPLLIEANDMAFPRINAIAFWLLPPAALLIWSGVLLVPFGFDPAQTGWTLYPPLSVTESAISINLILLGLHLSGVSTTMGAINFIVTIIAERGEGVTWANLDIISWTVLTQSGLILFAFPTLGSALLMLLFDRNFGTTFFAAGEGGGPILWQHLFWFFGHPEVYIIVLPPMGIISYVLPRFAGRRLFGFKFVVYSTLAIGVLSFGVWAHHMFSTGMDPRLRASFMSVSLAIAIPSAVKTFNWMATMWNGSLRLTTPMLFCVGFVSNFIIGGVTGVFLASIPVDLVLHDTHYVVGHFHYIVAGAILFALMARTYYWFPLVTGRMYQRKLGKWHFWLSMVGVNVTFLSLILLGYGGMPRRYATYLPQFATLNQVATLGAFLLGLGQVIWLVNMIQSRYEGPIVGDDPWDIEPQGLLSREWVWRRERRGPITADGGDPEGKNSTPVEGTDIDQPEDS